MDKIFDHKIIEKKWFEYWTELGIYKFDQKSTKPIFSVDTPPPYISSDELHVGHAMSYSQAEFIVRFYRMRGYNIFYPMGFDDNGLPTEKFVERKYKINKREMNRGKFIELCLDETKKSTKIYEGLCNGLGLSCDWSLFYSTIDTRCRKIAQRSFIDLYNKKRIERMNEPSMWCTSCQTALAQAEVETTERKSKLIHLYFTEENGEKIEIATSRPELIPACVAIFINNEDKRYNHLLGKKVRVPISNHLVDVYADPDVDPAFGTGVMMVCTWGDNDDVRRWKTNKLNTRAMIEKNGRINAFGGELVGLNIKEARMRAVEILKVENLFVKEVQIEHMLGVHDRCDTEMEFLLTEQWFIKLLDIKDKLLRRGDELRWYPDYYKTQYIHWVQSLKWDWCISRQRFYGVPFPVWYCHDCGEVILPKDSDLPVDPSSEILKIEKCPKCSGKNFIGDEDVMDTWMTSSLTPLINANWLDNQSHINTMYPMTVRVQAFEIIRTWLFYTILKSHIHTDSLPWRDAMISGWGLDKKGQRMSKSKNNYVSAKEAIEKYSGDAVRFWASTANLGSNLSYSEEEVMRGKKLSIKLWNVTRFISGHIENFNYDSSFSNYDIIDRWIISKLQSTIKAATQNFEKYEFCKATQATDKFFWMDLCDNYLEIVKERLYKPEIYGNDSKYSAQNTIYYVLESVLKLYAPIIPFITEEIYQLIFKKDGSPLSIHVSDWPLTHENLIDERSERAGAILVDLLVKVRGYKTSKSLSLNTPLEKIVINCADDDKELFKSMMNDVQSATRTKNIEFGDDADIKLENFDIKIGLK